MKRLVLLTLGLLIASLGRAQSFEQYLALRKQYSVSAPAGVSALQSFVGDKVLELKGVVKGSFRVRDRAALMLETAGGSTVIIDTDAVPDWLVGNETPARLLVRATKQSQSSALSAALIAVVPESQMAPYEHQLADKKKAAANTAKNRQSHSSRGGLWGPIGRGVSYNRGQSATASIKNWTLPASDVTPIYARFIRGENRRLSDAEALRIAQGIVGFSIQYSVDARLIMAMVMVESGFDPNSVSRTGAMGLGQLMPDTANSLDVQHPFDTMDNLYGTVKLVRTHLDQYKAQTGRDFDALVLSLAAYNAGPGAVKRAGGVPAYTETQNYVRKVISLYYRFAGIT